MNIFQKILLSVIQGITEFLPISSSGHLAIFQKILNISVPTVSFDVFLHFGTLFSILFFFKKDILNLIINWKENINIWQKIILASVPAMVIGLFLNDYIENIFSSLFSIGIFMIGNGILLLVTKSFLKEENNKTLNELPLLNSIYIGIFQAVAILPGISRSGSTISGGLFNKLKREEAFKFSFFLSIPAILGASVLKVFDTKTSDLLIIQNIIPFLISFIFGYFALVILQKLLKSKKFYLFGYYSLIFGILVLLFK